MPHKSRPPDAISKHSHPQYFHIKEHTQHKQRKQPKQRRSPPASPSTRHRTRGGPSCCASWRARARCPPPTRARADARRCRRAFSASSASISWISRRAPRSFPEPSFTATSFRLTKFVPMRARRLPCLYGCVSAGHKPRAITRFCCLRATHVTQIRARFRAPAGRKARRVTSPRRGR